VQTERSPQGEIRTIQENRIVDFILTPIEVRALGCLIEKEMTTPDYYPLSLNALQNACNQTSNRHPVVAYDEAQVRAALEQLKAKGFVSPMHMSRVTKYEERFLKRLNLVRQETAVLCVLMLRGQQTPGEIRSRAERIHPFESLEDVLKTIETLEGWGYVTLLPRQQGRKEARYAHLFSGTPLPEENEEEGVPSKSGPAEEERISCLETSVDLLRQEVADLKQTVADFKAQFE